LFPGIAAWEPHGVSENAADRLYHNFRRACCWHIPATLLFSASVHADRKAVQGGDRRLRILTFTTLFPNSVQPVHGIFIYQRMLHVARRPGLSVQVVAPVPYFPRWIKSTRWGKISHVPRQEKFGELTVFHPRYLLVPGISMPLHGLLIFLGSLSTIWKLRTKNQFDCIDAHYVYPEGLAAVLFGRLFRIPVVLSARGTDVNLFPAFRSIRPMIRWSLQHASGIIAVSKSLKQAMVELGLPEETIQVIGNGIDPVRFHPLEPREARRLLGLAEDEHLIVAVGGLIPRKGFQFLIPAFAKIAPRFPRVKLYILGEGDYRQKLEAMMHQFGMADRVFLPGNIANDQLRLWFSAAEISCLVSSREGWPNVLLESMACGTPVVATNVWGAPEVIVSPDLGILVEQNVDSIATALEQGLQKSWHRPEIAQYASKRTWTVVAEEVEDCLAQSIGARKKPR
jgi:teichuronic acid biosynthesis glycosyltransferase TuaC